MIDRDYHMGIGLELSNQCNMTEICKHCDGAVGVYGRKKKFIPSETLEIVKKESHKFFSSITYTGGEVACYSELLKEMISAVDLPYAIMTNGLKVIDGINPDLVIVSIDPPDIRPGIDNRKILENILTYDCDISVNTVLSAQSDIFDLYHLLVQTQRRMKEKGRRVREWKLSFLVDRGFASKNRSIFPDWRDIFSQIAKFLPIYFGEVPFHLAIRGVFYTKEILNISEDNSAINLGLNPCRYCLNRRHYTVINLEGNLQLCTVARNVSVKIDNSCDLSEALDNINNCKELKTLSYSFWSECQSCRYFQICGGGCPGLSYIYAGEWTGRDVYQCEIMKNMEEFLLPVFPISIRNLFRNKIDCKGRIY